MKRFLLTAVATIALAAGGLVWTNTADATPFGYRGYRGPTTGYYRSYSQSYSGYRQSYYGPSYGPTYGPAYGPTYGPAYGRSYYYSGPNYNSPYYSYPGAGVYYQY